jgi:hypothetical protein
MANEFESFLERAGRDILKVITMGAMAAKEAAPFVDLYNPAVGELLSQSATVILTAQTAGAAAAKNAPATDTNAQKAALAVAAIAPLAQQFAKAVGVSDPTEAQVLAFNNALVAALNAFGVAAPAAAA